MPQLLHDSLTPREARVLDLLKEGLSNKQIARSIAISEQTVKYHLKNLYVKLGAQGRTHAVALSGDMRSDAPVSPLARAEEERARIEIPQSPLAFMRRTRKLHGTREAVVDGDLRFTYEELFQRCDRASAAWLSLGVTAGDRVATVAPNSHSHLEQFYALAQIGAVIVPIHARLTADDFATLIRHSGARLVCASAEYLELIDNVRSQLGDVQHFVALDGPARAGWLEYETLLAESDGVVPPLAVQEGDLLSINYTSGTTFQPKGAMLTHRNLWLNTVGALLHWPIRPEDRYLWLLPMFHANGWGYVWTVMAAGAVHVCARSTQTEALASLFVNERITVLCAAKSALIAMAHVPENIRKTLPTTVRVLTAGSSPAAATLERIEQRLGWDVTHAYGLSETSPFIAVREMSPTDRSLPLTQRIRMKLRQGTELLTSGELQVVDEEGQIVPNDGVSLGEIVVRGGIVMKGYYKDPEASARAFAGGWFHTGDAAVVHPDGTLEIRDRFKDIIISGDDMVSSIEVEDVLLRHPALREVAVVGVPHPQLGESAHAFFVAQNEQQVASEELRTFAADHLAQFKVPTSFTLLDELPKTATGKIQKQLLRGF